MSQNKKDELKQVTCLVKALIFSCKPPCLLSNILKDYMDIENKELPYRTLGYKSAQELLLDTGDFHFSAFGNGDVIVTAKCAKPSHIEDMILIQRNNKSTKIVKTPRHLREIRSTFEDQNNNNSPNRSRIIQNSQQRNAQNLKQQSFLRAESGQPRDLRDLLNSKKKLQQTINSKEEQNKMNDLRPILGAKSSTTICESNTTENVETNQPELKKRSVHIKPDQCEKSAQFVKREDIRIQSNNIRDITSSEKANCNIKCVPNIRDTIKNEVHNFKKKPQSQEPTSAIKQLKEYCASQGYSEPKYNVLMKKASYLCLVHINDSVYSTYPQEYETEYLAQEACSTRALELIRAQNVKEPLPVCSFSQTEFLNKLYKELLKHPYGIFAKNLPELFADAFGQSLPENWYTLVQASNNFLIESIVQNRVIIFANKDEVELQQQKPPQQGEPTKLPDGPINNNKILLPWSEDCWNIYITYCVSTTEIWGRLFGNNYNVRFELLMSKIKTDMQIGKRQPLSINENDFYLIYINECWHRVQVKELDTTKNRALCFFIDFGDPNWSPVSELYECKAEFLDLPAQAVQFSLHGLEEFENNPYARKCLDELLPTKAVVGEILTKKKDFCSDTEANCKIQVVLYDTSTEEDINLNDRLTIDISVATPSPEIKGNTLINAIVTNICDDGAIYLQLQNGDWKYIQKILEQTVKSKLEVEHHKATYNDLKKWKVFLICDDNESNIKWYRGKLIDEKSCKNYFEVFYIDFGLRRRVHISKIFLLDNLSVILRNFPHQAIKVRLHDIPDVTSKTVSQMRGFLPLNCDVLVKLAVPCSHSLPLVKLYVRFNESGPLCAVNDAICIEYELERSSIGDKELTRNDHVAKDLEKSQKTCNILKQLEDYNGIPNVGEHFRVRIALSATPSHFIVQPYDHYEALQKLMKELQVYCATDNKIIPGEEVEVGQAYAVKNSDGFYHRAIATKKLGDIIHVVYCDFGEVSAVISDLFKTLPTEFRQLPKMAIKAKLFGIRAIGDDWTLNDVLLFRKWTVGKSFVAIVKKILEEPSETSTRMLELELIDVSTEVDVCINQLLLTEERALRDV